MKGKYGLAKMKKYGSTAKLLLYFFFPHAITKHISYLYYLIVKLESSVITPLSKMNDQV